jgi:uncharacterized protein YegL
MAQRWGQKAVRVAIAIGDDADLTVLQKFIGENSEQRPLVASNVQDLVKKIKWVSTAVTKEASKPSTATNASPSGANVVVPPPPANTPPASPSDVF